MPSFVRSVLKGYSQESKQTQEKFLLFESFQCQSLIHEVYFINRARVMVKKCGGEIDQMPSFPRQAQRTTIVLGEENFLNWSVHMPGKHPFR